MKLAQLTFIVIWPQVSFSFNILYYFSSTNLFMYVLTMLLPQYHDTDQHSHQHPDHCWEQLLAGWEWVQLKTMAQMNDGDNKAQGQNNDGTR